MAEAFDLEIRGLTDDELDDLFNYVRKIYPDVWISATIRDE